MRSMKTCFKCKRTKPLSEFYIHYQMADGYLNKCKECTKRDVRKHYRRNKKKVDDYDRWRHKARPEKYLAQVAVRNAVARGNLVKGPCAVCGSTERIHGHHDDYSKRLEVIWLCPKHHGERHRMGFYPSAKHPKR